MFKHFLNLKYAVATWLMTDLCVSVMNNLCVNCNHVINKVIADYEYFTL